MVFGDDFSKRSKEKPEDNISPEPSKFDKGRHIRQTDTRNPQDRFIRTDQLKFMDLLHSLQEYTGSVGIRDSLSNSENYDYLTRSYKTEKTFYRNSVNQNDYMISNMLIFNQKLELVHTVNVSSQLDYHWTKTIKFFDILTQFARDSLLSSFVAVENDNELVCFIRGEHLLFSLTLLIGNKVAIGQSLVREFQSLCMEIETEIETIIESGHNIFENHENIDEAIAIVNSKSDYESSSITSLGMKLGLIAIFDPEGNTLFAKTFQEKEPSENSLLLSSLVNTLQILFENSTANSFKSIQFSGAKLYLRWFQNHLYAVLVDFNRAVELSESNPLNLFGNELLDNLIQHVNILGSLEGVDKSLLNALVDSFVDEIEYKITLDF